MKTKEFKKADGTVSKKYLPEKGDEFEALYSKVGERESLVVIKGKAKKIYNYFLGVKTKDNQEISLKITEGQKKVLDKVDLKSKIITFEEYENKEYGKLLGVRVKSK